MTARKFAKGTNVEVVQTITDVEGQVYRFGGRRFQHDSKSGHGVFQFELRDPIHGWLTINFSVLLAGQDVQERRRRYRSTFAYIKASLIAADDGIKSPAEIFHSHIVDERGVTMFEKTRHLLPAPR